MKLVKKIVPVVLSLTLCASMVAPSFAATFKELQGAINTGNSVCNADGSFKIEASKGESGAVNVTLHEDVTYQAGDPESITIAANQNVVLNLNGNTIDGGYNAETGEEGNRNHVIYVKGNSTSTGTLEINGGASSEDTTRRGTITGGNSVEAKGKYGQGGAIFTYGDLTINNVDIKGNNADTIGGGIAAQSRYGDITVTLNDTNVTGNTAKEYGGGISAEKYNVKDVFAGTVTLEVNGGSISGNATEGSGGGIYESNCNITLNEVEMNGNTAEEDGGAIRAVDWIEQEFEAHTVKLEGVTMTGNTAGCDGGAISTVKGDITLDSVTITGNAADEHGGGVWADKDSSITFNGSGNNVSSNSADIAGDDIFAEDDSKLALGNTDWRMDNEDERNANVAYEATENGEAVGLKAGNVVTGSDTPSTTPETGSTGSGEAEVEIDEVEVPLAGLFTRADAIGYLWQQAGEPEWELSDFEDVPEDHQWAVAIGWAQDMGIAVADLEGNFRPDDLVLRSVEDIELSPEGELQEFLNRYAVYAGIELADGELFIELAGEPDDIIMGEDAQIIFDDFFAKLEAALSAAA